MLYELTGYDKLGIEKLEGLQKKGKIIYTFL